ncbi:uncharacterized protein LOC124287484 [Haliotis rubra]|uniref:uncharacterized protein LOC124287484 n=1 Tax=Haliotis rubra TaxID=36100 RepID=UPI001EE50BB7|nr:uncharacterized protein LOC124287484 [Haliotis rubra]
MMNFVDAVAGVQVPPRGDMNFTLVPWALKMLDSYGKLPSGIYERNLHWQGSPGECRGIRAQMSAGVVLGNTTLTSPFDFKGKYCRAEFHHLSWVANILQMDDALTWGMCVPDTCSEKDVEGLFQLGFMKKFKITPDNVSCSDSQKHNGHVHVTSGTTTRPSVATTNAFDLLIRSYSDCKDRIRPDELMNCLFSPCDIDKNGNISKREWQTESHRLGMDMADHGKIARTFIELDINKDLQIDAPDLEYLFAFFDDTGDGLLSLPEYIYNWQSLIS